MKILKKIMGEEVKIKKEQVVGLNVGETIKLSKNTEQNLTASTQTILTWDNSTEETPCFKKEGNKLIIKKDLKSLLINVVVRSKTIVSGNFYTYIYVNDVHAGATVDNNQISHKFLLILKDLKKNDAIDIRMFTPVNVTLYGAPHWENATFTVIG